MKSDEEPKIIFITMLVALIIRLIEVTLQFPKAKIAQLMWDQHKEK